MTRVRVLLAAGSAGLLAVLLTGPGTPAGVRAAASVQQPRVDGRIVFTDNGSGRIETVNPDGTALQVVTPAGDSSGGPSWSPDASWIVYSTDHGAGGNRIFVIRPDGSGIRMVTDDPAGVSDFVPRFTPDGARVVYARCRPDPPGGCAIWSVGFDGAGKRALTAYDPRGGFDFQSDVSPDGRRLAFVRYNYRGIRARIWVSGIDGSHAHPITPVWLEAGLPRWTPDGHHLLVTNNIWHLADNVYRVRDDGTGVTRLTNARFPHNEQWADPSPSGSRIVLSDDRAHPGPFTYALSVMGRHGSGEHAIVADGSLVEPDWGTAPLLAAGSSAPSTERAPARSVQRDSSSSQPTQGLPPALARQLGQHAQRRPW